MSKNNVFNKLSKSTGNDSIALAVFCGSELGNQLEYKKATQILAQEFIENKITLVYGGGKTGLMGVMADTILMAGGNVIGITTAPLKDKEVAHDGLSDLQVTETLHERKALMDKYADGFVVLPGGVGTLDELFDIFTLSKIGLHNKPCAILNVSNYYDHLLNFIDHMVVEGFLSASHRDTLVTTSSAKTLVAVCLEAISKNLNEKATLLAQAKKIAFST